MDTVLSMFPLDALGAVALVCVLLAMTALGAGVRPARLLGAGIGVMPIAAALGIALVAIPAAAILIGGAFDLRAGALVGLLLMGISPGAPLALRRSRDAGGDADYALVLQVTVAVLAIVAVPAWIMILGVLYGRDAGISLALLARQVFVAQILPLACGAALAHFFPDIARRAAGPMLRLSGVLLAGVALLLLAHIWSPLLAIPLPALGASLALALLGIGLAHWTCGPDLGKRTTSVIVCSLRNPGIAILVASANGLPDGSKVMIIAHALITAVALAVYIAIVRRRGNAAPSSGV
jgi:predicted Na+-dependent transporter